MMPEEPLDPNPTPFEAVPYDPTTLPPGAAPSLPVSAPIKSITPVGFISFGPGGRAQLGMGGQLVYDGTDVTFSSGLFASLSDHRIPVKPLKAIIVSSEYQKFVFKASLGWLTVWLDGGAPDLYTAMQNGPYGPLMQLQD